MKFSVSLESSDKYEKETKKEEINPWTEFFENESLRYSGLQIDSARILDRYIVAFSLGTFVLTGLLQKLLEVPEGWLQVVLSISFISFFTAGMSAIFSYWSITKYYEKCHKHVLTCAEETYRTGLDSIKNSKTARLNTFLNRVKFFTFALAFTSLATVLVCSTYVMSTPDDGKIIKRGSEGTNAADVKSPPPSKNK